MGALVQARSLFLKRRKSLLSGFAPLLLTLIILIGTGQLRAQNSTVVLLEPQPLNLNQGETRRMVVRIEDAVDVFGVQIDLTFDPSRIKVLDENETKSGVQILAGDFLPLSGGFEAANEVNNETGLLRYAYSRMAPAEPASGSGTLFEFEVEALESGPVELQFAQAIAAAPTGAEIEIQVGTSDGISGTVFVPNPTAPAAAAAAATATAAEAELTTAAPTATAQTAENPSQPTVSAPSAATSSSGGSTSPENNPTAAAQAATAVPDTGAPTANNTLAPSNDNDSEPAVEPGETAVVPDSPTPASAAAEEIAAVPGASDEENAAPTAEATTPPLIVIGQDQRLEDIQVQTPTPAPAANNEGTIGSISLAVGLIVLSIVLIAAWFLMRIRSGA
jgi:hypothetical protein